ncbi:hypothetical protein [Streptomyces sp. NPDC005507]|uniref:hypothetical protein n=1 Tax=unclassified Streptomyces TaxID=2593676 RepID=UPI0033A358A4
MTTDIITGAELAETLLKGVGNEQMQAATRLLGAHREGYWLRRLLEEQTLTASANQPVGPVIDRTGAHPSVDWNAVGLILLTQPWVLQCSSSELAVLEFAASLVGKVGVNLHKALSAVDARELELLLKAMREAA